MLYRGKHDARARARVGIMPRWSLDASSEFSNRGARKPAHRRESEDSVVPRARGVVTSGSSLPAAAPPTRHGSHAGRGVVSAEHDTLSGRRQKRLTFSAGQENKLPPSRPHSTVGPRLRGRLRLVRLFRAEGARTRRRREAHEPRFQMASHLRMSYDADLRLLHAIYAEHGPKNCGDSQGDRPRRRRVVARGYVPRLRRGQC